MNALILNRDFKMPEDGWYHLVPTGEYPITWVANGRREELIQVVDAEAAQAICNRFAAEMQDPRFPGVLVDFDHFSDEPDKPSEAAGWVTALENRADGVWGQVRWSDRGEAAVKGGRYRLVSPVWLVRDCAELGNRRVRPLRLHKVALTNDPNMKGMMPLSNRVAGGGGSNTPSPWPSPSGRGESALRRGDQRLLTSSPTGGKKDLRQAAGAAGAGSEHKHERQKMQNVAKKLGLSAEASEEAVLNAVTQLMNRAETAEQANEPLKNKVKTLETQTQTLLDAQVEQDLAKYSNRFKPEAKPKWKAALIANREQTIELLEGITSQEPGAGSGEQRPLLNRGSAKTPSDARQADATREQADKIANRAKQIQGASPNMSWNDAWNLATEEVNKK